MSSVCNITQFSSLLRTLSSDRSHVESQASSHFLNTNEGCRDHYEDVEEPPEVEDNGNSKGRQTPSLYAPLSKTIVSFSNDDRENPFNWSKWKKAAIVLIGIVTVLNSTLGSSLPSGDGPEISKHFDVFNEEQLVLPVSIFLVGYVLGPLIFSPLSEEYGRQIVLLATFAAFTVFTLAVCFAPNFAAFIVLRMFCGVFASSPISVIGGLYADLYEDPVQRGRAMALFMTATTMGPVGGPIVSGYLGIYSWKWPFWFALIFAGVSWIPLAFLPETFGPIILKRRAQKIRKETGASNVYAPIELIRTDVRDIVTKVLTRPIRMFFTEAIVLFGCLFLCLAYAIFYLFFQVFPVVYPPIYGFSLGEEGLSFLPIGLGAVIACVIYLWWDWYLQRAKEHNMAWARSEEYRRLPLACIGGPFLCIGIFWISWAARTSVHWIVPMLGGIPFGIGFLLLFMALINYIVDACKSLTLIQRWEVDRAAQMIFMLLQPWPQLLAPGASLALYCPLRVGQCSPA